MTAKAGEVAVPTPSALVSYTEAPTDQLAAGVAQVVADQSDRPRVATDAGVIARFVEIAAEAAHNGNPLSVDTLGEMHDLFRRGLVNTAAALGYQLTVQYMPLTGESPNGQ